MTSPMIVTADADLLEEVHRLAAAAGVTLETCRTPEAALDLWTRSPIVLVGADLAPAVAALRPARRDGTHVVTPGAIGDGLFGVALALGAESVAELPRSEGWLVEQLTDAGDQAPSRGITVGVVGGSGGAGATTFACALGQTASAATSAIVIDLDPLGPGLDRVLGVELTDGIRWDALHETTGRLSARSLHDAVPRRGHLGVLTWPTGRTGSLQAFAVREALSAAQRGHDLVIVDLPRAIDKPVAEVVARCDLVVVVVRPTLTGVAGAARLVPRFQRVGATRLLVRGHGVPVRDVEQATCLPGAWAMSDQRNLAESIDLGLGPVRSRRGPLARAAGQVLEMLADRTVVPGSGLAA